MPVVYTVFNAFALLASRPIKVRKIVIKVLTVVIVANLLPAMWSKRHFGSLFLTFQIFLKVFILFKN